MYGQNLLNPIVLIVVRRDVTIKSGDRFIAPVKSRGPAERSLPLQRVPENFYGSNFFVFR